MSERTCVRCGSSKPLTSFPWCQRKGGARRHTCRACFKTIRRRKAGAQPRPEDWGEKGRTVSQPTRRQTLRSLHRCLSELLTQRCEAEGRTVVGVRWAMRYQHDPAFRQKERQRTSIRRHAAGSYALTDRRTAAARTADGSLTPAAIRHLFAHVQHCAYCEESLHPRQKTLDHVEPLAYGGTHTLDNAAIVCLRCNVRKHAEMPTDAQRAAAERQRTQAFRFFPALPNAGVRRPRSETSYDAPNV